jgi:2-phosphosulfolactate phosphatase
MSAPARTIDVYFLPTLTTPEQLAGKTVVVIDVLRATTTTVQALASGAREVIPCLEVDEARNLARKFQGPCLLGGERKGGKIDGFDWGLAARYARWSRAEHLLHTTNGTRALLRSPGPRVLLGAFTNLSTTVDALASAQEIALLCAGTDGQITREDVLLAGALVEKLGLGRFATLNDQARIAGDAWRGCVESGSPLDSCCWPARRPVPRLSANRRRCLASQIDQHPLWLTHARSVEIVTGV